MLTQPQAWCFVSAWFSSDGTSSSPGRVGPVTTTLFIARALCWLNFSTGSHQTLSLSATTFHLCTPHRHCGRVYQTPWANIVPYFQSTRVSPSQTIGCLSRWLSEMRRATEFLSSLRLAFYARAVTVSWNPCPGFKACRLGVILQLALPVCLQSHLVYLVMTSSASFSPPEEPGTLVGTVCCFFLWLWFLLSCCLFCDAWCFLFLQNIVCLCYLTLSIQST